MDKTGTKLEAYPRKLLVQNAITWWYSLCVACYESKYDYFFTGHKFTLVSYTYWHHSFNTLWKWQKKIWICAIFICEAW